MNIPVFISSDNNIFFTVGVVLVSLLENAKEDTFYQVHLLYTSDVTEENKNKILTLKNKYKNFSLEMHDMGDKFHDLPQTQGYHVNYVSAYKMLIPSMFPQYDKALYLDTDILVRGDLQDFYNFEIGDNYIASTPVMINCVQNYDYIKNLIGLDNLDYYVNAGVMIMNLKQIREDKIDEKWISLLGTFEGSVDQHILNKVCYGKTCYIPIKYNVCLVEIPFIESKEVGIYYSLKEAEDALKNPVIFHWAGPEKPWLYDDTFLAQEWFKYFTKSPFSHKLTRGKCNFFRKPKITKIRWSFLGIPILTIRKWKRTRIYLFGFIRIGTIKTWKGK